MPHIKKILVPVDLDENATTVVGWAAFLARLLGSRLILLHVNESVTPLGAQPGLHSGDPDKLASVLSELHSAYDQTAKLRLTALAEQTCEGLGVDIELVTGRAKLAIIEQSKAQAFDLIVIGTHGRPWYQQMLLGSTAEAVLRSASVPTLIVHNLDPRPTQPQLKKILFPSDFSPACQVSEAWVADLAGCGTDEVDLLHVIENPLIDLYEPDTAEIDFRHLMEEAQQRPPRYAQPFWEHAHRVAEDRLGRLRQDLLADHPRTELFVQEGIAAEQILKCAKEQGTDLIIMSTHGRTGVQHLVLGSVTEKVVRTASCPVLAIPSRA